MKLASLSSLSRQFPEVEVEYQDLLKWRYRSGGRTSEGVDCLGLLLEVFKRAGIGIPDLKLGSPLEFQGLWNQVNDADTLFDVVEIRRSECHLGTVIRIGQVISVSERERVKVHPLRALKRITGVRFWRLKPEVLPEPILVPTDASFLGTVTEAPWEDTWPLETQEAHTL